MWSSSARRAGSAARIALLALALATPLALAGCSSLRPVYGSGGPIGQRLEVSYAKPATRLEQIIVQELALKLGNSDRPDVPRVRITANAGAQALTRTNVSKPATQYEAAVTATYAVLDVDGKVLLSGSRRATASYVTVGQVLADEAAYKDAVERAGREVAETIRLSILGRLVTPVREAALADE